MVITHPSKFAAMTAEDRKMFRQWARWVVGIYASAWLLLTVVAFVVPATNP